jgi:hypothetical protein
MMYPAQMLQPTMPVSVLPARGGPAKGSPVPRATKGGKSPGSSSGTASYGVTSSADASPSSHGVQVPLAADATMAERVQHLLTAFPKDADAVNFVIEHFSIEVCRQLRDWLVADCDTHCGGEQPAAAAPEPQPDDDPDANEPKCRAWATCVSGRGAVIVAVMSILTGAPRSNREAEDVEERDIVDAENDVRELTRVTMRHFPEMHVHRRGSIAVPRIVIAAAAQPDACVDMLAAVTAAMPEMVFHAHANYAVTGILRRLPEILPLGDGAAAQVAGSSPTASPGASPTGASSSSAAGGTAPLLPFRSRLGDRFPNKRNQGAGARTAYSARELAGHRAFVAKLTEVLSANIRRACEEKFPSHVLEVALSRNDFVALPDDTLPLLDALVPLNGDAAELRGIFDRPASGHVMRAFLTAVTVLTAEMPPAGRARLARAVLQLSAGGTICEIAAIEVAKAKDALVALAL